MNKENSALKLVDEIILYYDARSKKYQATTLLETFLLVIFSLLLVGHSKKIHNTVPAYV